MNRRTMAASALLLIVACAALFTWRGGFHRRPVRVQLEADYDWAGFTAREREGLMLVASDLLELGGATLVSGLPADGGQGARLHLWIRKEGAVFRIRAEWTGAHGRTRDFDIAEPDPRHGMLRLAEELGFGSREGERLMPTIPEDLLPLAEGMAITYAGSDGEFGAFAPRLDALLPREQDSPLAALVEGMVRYRSLLTRTPGDPERQALTRQSFQRCLALLPDYPRACIRFSLYLTDTGGQREALDLLFEAVGVHPGSPGLHSALAYAARTAGLLDGSKAALLRVEELVGPGARQTGLAGLAENTWLYRGEWSRFAEGLGPGSDERQDPTGDFYRGYIRLLQRKPEEALPFLRRAEAGAADSPQFALLAKVYRLSLERHEPEARTLLAELESTRTQLRVPDGEYTFKLAEAHAFIGDHATALETALRAASQGFECTAWYEASPLLRPLQGLPRFKALVQHLRERQQLMESHFPTRRFER
ncbi:MAG TPA: hypothetical protein VJ483_04055 [Holophagaceae bacterium]|nr:hypothetical protein [Holophagaceae bacterium]